MNPFSSCTGIAAPIQRENLDTDMIIRIDRMTHLQRGDLAPWAFENLRYRDGGAVNESFILNQPPFDRAKIIIGGRNFGCGSSREPAVWALQDFGIQCVIAPSFGEIFFTNCIRNGVLPVVLDAEVVKQLAEIALQRTPVRVDLLDCSVSAAPGFKVRFALADHCRQDLLEGRDDIVKTFAMQEAIDRHRVKDRATRPWAYIEQTAAVPTTLTVTT